MKTEELERRLRANGPNERGVGSMHSHIWVKDDRPGWREWVCVVCAMVWGVKDA